MIAQLDLFGTAAPSPARRQARPDTALLLAMSADHTTTAATAPPFTKEATPDSDTGRAIVSRANAARDAMLLTPEWRELVKSWGKPAHDQPPSDAMQLHRATAAQTEAEAKAAAEADNAALDAKLEAFGFTRYAFEHGHCLTDPKTREGQWALPSRQFRFPVATNIDDTGRRYVYLADNPLRDHPLVGELEAAGIRVHDYNGEYGFGTGQSGRWHHAVDLACKGEVAGLIATRHFTDDWMISQAVAHALNSTTGLDIKGARQLMGLFNWPEIKPAMMREFLDAPAELSTGEKSRGWPVRFKRGMEGENCSHGRAWCYIVGIERGWISYDRSGFAKWSEAGRAWWAGEGEGDGLL